MILLETIQRDCPPDLSGGFFLKLAQVKVYYLILPLIRRFLLRLITRMISVITDAGNRKIAAYITM